MDKIRECIEWLEIEASKSQFDSPYSECLATMEKLLVVYEAAFELIYDDWNSIKKTDELQFVLNEAVDAIERS